MAKIIKLDQKITNLIAAGEVVTGPAAVVKELVENAIDAAARHITISLVDSGLKEIIVTDDGLGMAPADARLALEPHATSKIKESQDLFQIKTLGFRGEALPSMVAVSHFIMKTSPDGIKGMMYSLKGGDFISEAMIAFPQGTEITVKNLFYNIPARLQSLQSLSTELSYILDFLDKMALARPDVAFKLTNNNRFLMQTFGTNRQLEVIQNVYGTEVAKNMKEIYESAGFFQVKGYIGNISVSKSTRNHITIIVNGRVIRNNKLISAVYEAYQGRLPGSRYPICVININVDPALIDVNIHPQKAEIRFSNEEELLQLLTQTIDNMLNQIDLIVDKEIPAKDIFIPPQSRSQSEYRSTKSQSEYLSEDDFSPDSEAESYFDVFKTVTPETPEILKEAVTQQEFSLIDNAKDLLIDTDRLPKMYYIGQLFGTYILAQNEDDFFLIDQHAAYERINYELYKEELKRPDHRRYELLIPFKINFTSAEAALVRERFDDFLKIGLELEDFGGGTYTVRKIPVWIPKGREQEFTEEIIMKHLEKKQSEKHQFLDYLAASLACKRSVKANEPLTKESSEDLLTRLNVCENPYNCPHGRPVIIKFSRYEIEKWFKRVL
ncbi:MAG: DNA mismatch repair endonuclease MutL [Bacilli bacterium]|nr:DNA mismatch repair endonuclease MutL [Bacilli bacterium]MDD4076907.1 DNA mismatch repair endonuclease MutL [Bacilli bacterium]